MDMGTVSGVSSVLGSATRQCLKTHPQLCTAHGGVLVAKSKPQRSSSRSQICKLDFKEVCMGDSRAVAAGRGDPSCECVHARLKSQL